MKIRSYIKSPRPLILGGSLLFLSTFNALSAQAADDKPWSIKASAGAEYNSNISIPELDLATRSGDSAALLDFSADYEAKIDKSTSLTVGYGFSQNLHKKATNFDLQSHILTAGAKQKFSNFDLGVDYLYINTSLGRKSFLQLHKATPYISFFATPALFVRGEYSFTKKIFKTSSDRDAKTNSFGGSTFYFMNNSKTFIMLTYKYDSVKANASHYDYKGHDVKLRYQVKFPWSDRDARFYVTGRYIKRNYTSITPSISALRRDKKTSIETLLDIPFLENWTATFKYRYTNAKSNLASADYKESLASVDVGYKF